MIQFTSWEDPVVGFEVKPFNWRLRKGREAKGWSRADLARQIGVHPGVAGDAEALKHVSATVREKIACALEIPEDVLFPGVIDAFPPDDPGMMEIPFTEREVERWRSGASCDPLDDVVTHEAMRQEVRAVVTTLPPRVQRTLVERFGLDGDAPRSLDEIAKELGLSRERIHQFEIRGLRDLRHPRRSHHLKALLYDLPERPAPAPKPARSSAPKPAPAPKRTRPTAPKPKRTQPTVPIAVSDAPPMVSLPERTEFQSWVRAVLARPREWGDVGVLAGVLYRDTCCSSQPTVETLLAHYGADHHAAGIPVSERSWARLRAFEAAYRADEQSQQHAREA